MRHSIYVLIYCYKLSHLLVKSVKSNVILSNVTLIECYKYCHYKKSRNKQSHYKYYNSVGTNTLAEFVGVSRTKKKSFKSSKWPFLIFDKLLGEKEQKQNLKLKKFLNLFVELTCFQKASNFVHF
jgi:hypothetical protein